MVIEKLKNAIVFLDTAPLIYLLKVIQNSRANLKSYLNEMTRTILNLLLLR